MGLSISWVAAEGVNRSAMLGALGLADVGRPARGHPVPPPAKLAAFELGGWVFVISPDRRFASRERVSAVSQAGSAVGAYLEEHVMVSGAFGASDGRLAWSVQHDPEFGQEHLDVWGEPPAALTGIRARLLQELRTDDDDDVDYLFDAPTELAATVCGFDPNQFSGEVDMLELSVVNRELMKLRDQPLASALADPGARSSLRRASRACSRGSSANAEVDAAYRRRGKVPEFPQLGGSASERDECARLSGGEGGRQPSVLRPTR